MAEDGWIGWHNDSGFMTGLTPDMFVDDTDGSIMENPDPEGAGLWIVDRDSSAVRVRVPPDCMAIQVGECTQVVTGGEFVATPHCVRGVRPQFTAGRKELLWMSVLVFSEVTRGFPKAFRLTRCWPKASPPRFRRWRSAGSPVRASATSWGRPSGATTTGPWESPVLRQRKRGRHRFDGSGWG